MKHHVPPEIMQVTLSPVLEIQKKKNLITCGYSTSHTVFKYGDLSSK
jgi:hypothetical protein